MGYYVHIHVCFACDDNDPVAALALKHLPTIPANAREARWFLESLSKRSGENLGPKGGLSLWGIVGNYTNGAEFCDVLRPFWLELIGGEVGGICNFENVVVICEAEDSGAATAYQVSFDEDNGAVAVKTSERLPFLWNQV